MKIPTEPVSAFAIYSEKLRQKKKYKNPAMTNRVSKIKTKANNNDRLNILQVKEINNIMQSLVKQSNDFVTNSSSRNTTEKSSENNANQQKKIKGKAIKKLSVDNIVKHVNNKNDNQANKLKSLSQETEVHIINHIQNETPSKGPIKKVKKNKSNPQKMMLANLQQKKEKQNLLQQKKNKMLSKKKDAVVYTNENKTYDENMSKRKYKVNKNKEFNKERKLGSNWTNQENSTLAAKRLFEWLILPISEKSFTSDYWEKKPLLIQREGNRSYFSELISTLEIDSMIRKNNVQFTKHLDITSYIDKKRETHNLSGRAQANVVWDFYTNGCSVRLLNPQAFLPKIHTLNATLQGYFGCFVGANVYLTPPNSQGFAPHYDDIEAFVLQIEGKKHWKVYAPRNDSEILPRYSSPNFTQDEIGDPILDVTLEPGDMLYFPRGFIHQASTVEGEHSLHITLSAYQKTAWIDLLEKAIPIALERAAAEDVEFRKGLPRDYLGIEFHGSDAEKESFTKTAQRLMSKVAHFLQFSLGAGVDKMGAQFMHDALPPVFTPEEKKKMVLGSGLKMKQRGKLVGRVEFEMESEIKLVRANACRLVEEEGELRLYHCLDNPLEYHAEDNQFLVLPPEGGEVITQISTQYPAYVKVKNLPHTDKDALLTLVSDLWDAGLLMSKELPTVDEEN